MVIGPYWGQLGRSAGANVVRLFRGTPVLQKHNSEGAWNLQDVADGLVT